MLTVTILGCGTSSGVPRIGGDWGACDATDPRNRRTRSSILVESATTRILVDTGPDLRQQLLNAGVNRLDAVLWTHDHADHTHGLDDLRPIAQNLGKAIPAFARQPVIDALRRRFSYAFEGRGLYAPIIAPQALADTVVTIGDIAIRSVDQPHGDIWSTGFRFEAGAVAAGYATDFHAVTSEMLSLFTNMDLWVVDALRQRPHPTHSHLALTLGAIEQARPRQALLTHMDNSMDYAHLSTLLPPGVAPGHDGLVIRLTPG